MEKLIGTTLGQYEIAEKVGQGGMAQVFKAYQGGLNRYVAIKVLSPILAEHPDFAERFQREAHSVARLNHPNILQVYDFGVQDKYTYLVMRYVENSVTLDALIKAGARVGQLVQYLIQVADALHYAHQQGIIHRDIKPSNILIDGKWALLADFGLVKMSESSSELTGTGLTMGTPAYMSPEQAAGKEVDHRTDIYALGIILYKILTGSVPHHAPTPLAIAIKRSTEPIPPLWQSNPNISDELEQAIQKSLKINPNQRYETAADFAQALQGIDFDHDGTMVNVNLKTKIDGIPQADLAGEGATIASKLEANPHPEPAKKRSSLLPIVMGLMLLLMVGGLGWFFVPSLSESTPTASATTTEVVTDDGDGTDNGAAISSTDTPTLTPTPIDTPVPAPANPIAIALAETDIRRGPDEIYAVIGGLAVGNQLEIVGKDRAGEWWQVNMPTGVQGWIPADPTLIEAQNTTNIIVAIPPPSPTMTPTDTPTSAPTQTPTATDTPSPTSTSTATAAATNTPTNTPTSKIVPVSTPLPTVPPPTEPPPPQGEFALLRPTLSGNSVTGVAEFEWQWSSPLAENQGFEVRIWRDGEAPRGVHDSVNDNKNGVIQALDNDRYRLVADITTVGGVNIPSGEYNWTVLLVQIDPAYQELGIQAGTSGRLRYAAPGGSGGGDSGGGGNGGGGGGGGSNR